MNDKQIYKAAACKPLPWKNATVTGGFWKEIIDRSANTGLPALLNEYENRNVAGNFIDTAAGRPRSEEGDNATNFDEFLFKALEACCYHLGLDDNNTELRAQYLRIRDIVLAAQQPDGYLNTLAIQKETPRHSKDTVQELYAGGHLMQAGIAELNATGETVLFNAARRYIDCLMRGYGTDGRGLLRNCHGNKWPDHPNIELALVELYRATGNRDYLDFCKSILDFSEYSGRTQMFNHAVCELLLAAGGTDYFLETGDTEIRQASERLWRDMLKKVYVSGGVGAVNSYMSLATRESIGKAHALSNDLAYAETCAAITLVFWSQRMFLATGAAEYLDMLERALYNGVLAGISLDGSRYFYENPLEYRQVTCAGSAAVDDEHADFRGSRAQRTGLHHCSCCPPNLHRLFASLQQYVFTAADHDIMVNLFMDSECNIAIDSDAARLHIKQETAYPWNGHSRIRIALENTEKACFNLKIRVPGWARDTAISINGNAVSGVPGTYAELNREWQDGDLVEIEMPMPGYLLQADPRHIANYSKLTIARGPLIYCLESMDHPGMDIFSLSLPATPEFKPVQQAEGVLKGMVLLEGQALLRDDCAWDVQPYQRYPAASGQFTPVKITAVPYFAWGNRGKGSMLTALPYQK